MGSVALYGVIFTGTSPYTTKKITGIKPYTTKNRTGTSPYTTKKITGIKPYTTKNGTGTSPYTTYYSFEALAELRSAATQRLEWLF